MSIIQSFGGIFTLSSLFVLLTICFVDARNENLSSSKFIALSNAFMNCTSSKRKHLSLRQARIQRVLQKGGGGVGVPQNKPI
jgi:hypothetical protein